MKTFQIVFLLLITCLFLIACSHLKQADIPFAGDKLSAEDKVVLQNKLSDSLKPELVVQLAHSQPITAMTLSGNGLYLATASWDRTIRLWSVTTGKLIRQFIKKHNNKGILSFALALSYDGNWLLSGGDDNTIYLWSTDTGQVISQYSGHQARITAMVLSADEQYLISGSRDKTIKRWQLADKNKSLISNNSSRQVSQSKTLATLADGIVALKLTPGGDSVIAASYTRAWKVDLNGSFRPKQFSEHPAGITALSVSPDGKYLLTGDLANNIWLSDLHSQKKIKSFPGHGDQIFSLDFSPDGRNFVSSSQDNSIRIWNIKQGTAQTIQFEKGEFINHVVFLKADSILYSKGPQLFFYNFKKHKEQVKFVNNVGWASAVAVSKNGNYLLVGSWDHTAYLWDLREGRVAHYLRGHHNDVRTVAFSPNNKMALTADRDGKAILWDVKTGQIIRQINHFAKGIKTAAFSPDSLQMVFGNDDGVLWLESITEDNNLRVLFPPANNRSADGQAFSRKNKIQAAMFSPDGKYILSCSNTEVFLWNSQNGQLIRTYKEHSGTVFGMDFSPDGRFFASAGADKQIIIHDLHAGTVRSRWQNPGAVIYTLAYSPDGQYLAVAGADENIRLWDIKANKILKSFKSSSSITIDLAFSPNGRHLFSSGADQMTQIWELASGHNPGSLIGFKNGNWAVVDQQGRYDASNAGNITALHWVIGKETIRLSQLKQRYYEPGLLSKILGYNLEPVRNIAEFSDPELYPKLSVTWDPKNKNMLDILLKERNGGIGKVVVFINGKEVIADARGYADKTKPGLMAIKVDVAHHPFLIPGKENSVEVFAYNKENYLSSRGAKLVFTVPPAEQKMIPTFWAIIAGISDYQGQRIDLRFAAKDALDFKKAISLGAKKLFGEDRVNIKLLTTETAKGAIRPTKQAFIAAFEQLKDAKPWDVLVIYMAGHALAIKDEYYYLTAEAGTIDLVDPEVVKQLMISGRELTQWLKQTPIQKQVLLLDTCAAGSIARSFSETREISSGQIRAIERMKDRTGLHVLMGSAANAVSYEATQFEQGLMTYALLEGMKGAALKENTLVDVSTLLQYAADKVPELAVQIGGIQRPRIASPAFSESFSIGYLDKTAQAKVPLAMRKTILLKPVFINQNTLLDNLNLTEKLSHYFREQDYKKMKKEAYNPASKNITYMNADVFSSAVYVRGIYQIKGNTLTVKYALGRDNQHLLSNTVDINLDSIKPDNSDTLAEKLASAIYHSTNSVSKIDIKKI